MHELRSQHVFCARRGQKSEQLLCFVHGQGQKSEQKHKTKNFVGFHNHSDPLY